MSLTFQGFCDSLTRHHGGVDRSDLPDGPQLSQVLGEGDWGHMVARLWLQLRMCLVCGGFKGREGRVQLPICLLMH